METSVRVRVTKQLGPIPFAGIQQHGGGGGTGGGVRWGARALVGAKGAGRQHHPSLVPWGVVCVPVGITWDAS